MTGAENLLKPMVARFLRAPDARYIRLRLLIDVNIAPRARGPVRTWVSGAENLTKPHLVCFARIGVWTVRTVCMEVRLEP